MSRGQAYTLEAVIAAVLILSALLFAFQVTAVTPLSASTSNQHIENQQRSIAAGALSAAADTTVEVEGTEMSALREAVLYCDLGEDGGFYGADTPPVYTNRNPSITFGAILNRSFGPGLAVNVAVIPENGGSGFMMIDRGSPSDNAVTVSRTVTVYNDDPITSPGSEQVGDAGHDSCLPLFDDEPANEFVYEVVRVEVTVWRM